VERIGPFTPTEVEVTESGLRGSSEDATRASIPFQRSSGGVLCDATRQSDSSFQLKVDAIGTGVRKNVRWSA
jgi:hypothetical protein